MVLWGCWYIYDISTNGIGRIIDEVGRYSKGTISLDEDRYSEILNENTKILYVWYHNIPNRIRAVNFINSLSYVDSGTTPT